jgi:hypothetical protein
MGTITSYSTLQSAIGDYLNRADLTSQIPMFIQFVEADLNTRLRCREMVVRATTTNDEEYVELPPDFLQALNLQIIGGKTPLRYVTLDEADQIKASQIYTQVVAYTILDDAIELVPAPADNVEIEMVYYQQVPALSNLNTTNWLLTKSPDVYLYGALVHASPFLMDDQRVNTFAAFYSQRVEALNLDSDRAVHSGSPLIARPRARFG